MLGFGVFLSLSHEDRVIDTVAWNVRGVVHILMNVFKVIGQLDLMWCMWWRVVKLTSPSGGLDRLEQVGGYTVLHKY